jgi:dolichol-phosphate mannosyltransferase
MTDSFPASDPGVGAAVISPVRLDENAMRISDPVSALAGPALSVVVPTRNEAANIETLWGRLQNALAGVAFELCVVDDSDDSTPQVLADLAASSGCVRTLHRAGRERAGGLSTAVVAGLRMATGRYVCVMDADLQHPPELIPKMLAAADDGADLVVASRYASGGSREGLGGGMRHLVSRCATAFAQVLFSEARRSADPLSGFFLCRRVLIDGIEFRPVGFKILLELLVCVPGITVCDVPLRFQARQAGESKAGLRQGLLFVGHCWSLFKYAAGSARYWKFGITGVSGLAVFLPVLWELTRYAGWNPLVAFVPAYAVSLAWNGMINWRWTFADQQRRETSAARRYVVRALLAGGAMFGVYAGLLSAGLTVVLAGLVAALVAMVINGVMNLRSVRRRRPREWQQLAEGGDVQAVLARLGTEIGADRAYLIDAEFERRSGLPAGMLEQVVQQRRPMLLTEAPSHRPQRRSNIEWTTRILAPVVKARGVIAVIICERRSVHGFDDAALIAAVRTADQIATALPEDQRKL